MAAPPGYNVWNRHDKRQGRPLIRPRSQWVWSPTPTHEAIVPREPFDQVEERAHRKKSRTIPDMRDALREANEDELIEVFDALDVCPTYTKPTLRLELAATVTPELVANHEKNDRPGAVTEFRYSEGPISPERATGR